MDFSWLCPELEDGSGRGERTVGRLRSYCGSVGAGKDNPGFSPGEFAMMNCAAKDRRGGGLRGVKGEVLRTDAEPISVRASPQVHGRIAEETGDEQGRRMVVNLSRRA